MQKLPNEPLYTIVIPTRDRHDVLKHSLQTVLNQTKQNFEVVVMDNFSSEETLKVIQEADDKRIKHARSSRRLSMSENWEEGLNHVSGDFVFYLGDDDGLLPDAIEVATRIHSWFPEHIISWKPVTWCWPDNIVEQFQNVLNMHISPRVEHRDSRQQLIKYYRYDVNFHESPGLYNSFVPTNFLKRFQSKYGKYFWSPIPDIYSGIINSYFHDSYIYSYRPLSVWAASRHSTGLSSSFRRGEQNPATTFESENKNVWKEKLEPNLSGEYLIENVIADVQIKTKLRFFPEESDFQINMKAVVDSMCLAARRSPEMYDQVILDIKATAARNNIPLESLNIPSSAEGPEKLIANCTMSPEKELVCFSFYTDPSLYPSVDKLVRLVASMSADVRSLSVHDVRAKASAKVES